MVYNTTIERHEGKESTMTNNECRFTVELISDGCGSYPVFARENTKLETIWSSQLCWFIAGSSVLITNTKTGESKVFVR